MISVIEVVAGLLIVAFTLWDTFETILLPRTVRRRYRPTRLIVRAVWAPWAMVSRLPLGNALRDSFLAVIGPLLLIVLIVFWAGGMVFGFALALHGLTDLDSVKGGSGFWTSLYLSGSTFFTLGLGDVVPGGWETRALTVVEAGTGFGFLAMVIGYLPIFYQAFSRREVAISLLDARAGSPPSAIEFMRRNREGVDRLLGDWEKWAAELLESHLSYPVLAYFRSQHDNQSWMAALTVILDASALVMTGIEGVPDQQARFSFAIARHALVDLNQVFFAEPIEPVPSRLGHEDFLALRALLEAAGFPLILGEEAEETLAALRREYEPLANSLSRRLVLDLPPWIPSKDALDAWQSSPWGSVPPMSGYDSC